MSQLTDRLFALPLIVCLLVAGCRESPKIDSSKPEQTDSSEVGTHDLPTGIPDSLLPLNVNGETLHYLVRGRGEPMVFVHGTISDYRTWSGYLESYAKDYRVIMYSRRYAWPNRQEYDSTADYSIHIHARDLEEMLRQLQIEKVILVGHSYGAFTSVGYALQHPDRVRALILGEPPMTFLAKNSKNNERAYEKFSQNTIKPASGYFKAGEDELGLEAFLQGVNANPDFKLSQLSDAEKEIWMDNLLELKGHTISEYYGDLDQSKLSELEVPTLIFVGDQSPKWLTALSVELHRILPDSRLDTLTDSSHGLYFQQPDQANQAMRAFLAMQH